MARGKNTLIKHLRANEVKKSDLSKEEIDIYNRAIGGAHKCPCGRIIVKTNETDYNRVCRHCVDNIMAICRYTISKEKDDIIGELKNEVNELRSLTSHLLRWGSIDRKTRICIYRCDVCGKLYDSWGGLMEHKSEEDAERKKKEYVDNIIKRTKDDN